MWKLSIVTTLEAEEAVAELLGTVFGGGVAIYNDCVSSTTNVAVYCRERPVGIRAKYAMLRQGLARIKGCGLKLGRGKITVRRVWRENWAEAWKRHFKPIELGDALLIKPSWSKQRPRKGQAVVILDPGLSFGTGHHPTTLFCLCELVSQTRCWEAQPSSGGIGKWRDRARPSRIRPFQKFRRGFLDLGTGSGILAIAAAKLGYAPVDAIDCDPESIRVARRNIRANRVSDGVRIKHQDLTQLPLRPKRRYDLICANLLSTLLVSQRERIVRLLKPGGALILAGILNSEFKPVANKYVLRGLQLLAARSDKGWRSGSFTW